MISKLNPIVLLNQPHLLALATYTKYTTYCLNCCFLCSFVADSVIGAFSKINVCVSVISFVATNVAV